MDINCGNSESTFNFPISTVNYTCSLTSNIQDNYKKLSPIDEGNLQLLLPTPTPSFLNFKSREPEVTYNLPIDLDLFTTLTPTGTLAPTPTPTSNLKQKYLINFKLTLYTEAILSINLREKYIMLQHSKEGKLPDTPIQITTSHYTNNILDDTSAVLLWNIPWKSSTIDKTITNTTKITYPPAYLLFVNVAKWSPYWLQYWFGKDKTTTDTVTVPNPKAPIQWSDQYFLPTGYQMFLTQFVNVYIIKNPTPIKTGGGKTGSIQIIEQPNLSNNFVAKIKIIDNISTAKNTDIKWDFTVSFQT